MMSKSVCNHNWIVHFDAKADQACYNDGFNYRPVEYICTQCKKAKKIKYADEKEWYRYLILIPFSLLVLLYLITIAPVLVFIDFIKDEILSKKES